MQKCTFPKPSAYCRSALRDMPTMVEKSTAVRSYPCVVKFVTTISPSVVCSGFVVLSPCRFTVLVVLSLLLFLPFYPRTPAPQVCYSLITDVAGDRAAHRGNSHEPKRAITAARRRHAPVPRARCGISRMSNTCHVVSNAVAGDALRTARARSQADNEGDKIAGEGGVSVQPVLPYHLD
jgi:hypothetical protein